jgi:hypothetical protein
MYKTKSFFDDEMLDKWLNDMRKIEGPFEIVGYQANWLGSAIGTEITVTIKFTV